MTVPEFTGNVLEVYEDRLVGQWFWWESGSEAMKRVYHGRVAAKLEGGFYLLRFDDTSDLPDGVHEIVHLERMAHETWSFFAQEAELRKALEA